MKPYKTKDMTAEGKTPAELECVRECVTPGVGAGTWAPGDKVSDPSVIRQLMASPYFKSTEVK